MHRAWKQSLIAAAATATLALVAPAARAYHTATTFDQPAGAGGGGGIFYTGAPSERGWNCTACHVEPAGEIRLLLSSEPAELVDQLRYTPGADYQITVTMSGEHRGQGSPRSNFNSFALSSRDGADRPTGRISGFAAEDAFINGTSTVVTGGQSTGVTEWTFTWTAPDPGTGTVSFYVAGVDGNGANSPPDQTLTDPFDDDVYVTSFSVDEGGNARLGASVALLVAGLAMAAL